LIFKDETNIRFLRMKPDEIIKDADFDED
jgi:hypothetical protein